MEKWNSEIPFVLAIIGQNLHGYFPCPDQEPQTCSTGTWVDSLGGSLPGLCWQVSFALLAELKSELHDSGTQLRQENRDACCDGISSCPFQWGFLTCDISNKNLWPKSFCLGHATGALRDPQEQGWALPTPGRLPVDMNKPQRQTKRKRWRFPKSLGYPK